MAAAEKMKRYVNLKQKRVRFRVLASSVTASQDQDTSSGSEEPAKEKAEVVGHRTVVVKPEASGPRADVNAFPGSKSPVSELWVETGNEVSTYTVSKG